MLLTAPTQPRLPACWRPRARRSRRRLQVAMLRPCQAHHTLHRVPAQTPHRRPTGPRSPTCWLRPRPHRRGEATLRRAGASRTTSMQPPWRGCWARWAGATSSWCACKLSISLWKQCAECASSGFVALTHRCVNRGALPAKPHSCPSCECSSTVVAKVYIVAAYECGRAHGAASQCLAHAGGDGGWACSQT